MRPRTRWLLAALLLLPACKWAFENIAATIRYVARYDSGVPKKEGDLTGGEQTGKWTFYYPDGRKRAEGEYQNDVQTGPWTSWYENGHLEWQGSYDDRGARAGHWTFFFDDGSTRAEGRLAGDVEYGFWTFFARGGGLQRRGTFVQARPNGFWQHAGTASDPACAGLCLDGTRVGTWTRGAMTQAADAATVDHPLPAGTRLVREVTADGVRRLGLLRDGAPIGGWATFHEGGVPRLSVVFENGAPRAFAMFDSGGELAAEGLLENHEITAWRVRHEGALRAEERTMLPPQPPGDGTYSPAALLDQKPPADVLATWLAELRAPAPPPPPPPAEPAPVVAPPVATEPVRVPAPKQPGWTVRESEELEGQVQDYLVSRRTPRASTGRYSVPQAMQGKPRRRGDLEGQPLPIEQLRSTDGSVVDLADYRGKKRVLLVVLRGYFGQVCVYCVAQTEALARCKDRFDDLNLEVLLIYPGPEGNEEAFLEAYAEEFGKGAPPYRVFYDPDLKLCKDLGIEGGDLAYPTTIFVDDQGVVRYAYTGAHRADRPAAEELMKFIKNLDRK